MQSQNCENCGRSLERGFYQETSGERRRFCSRECQRQFHERVAEQSREMPKSMMMRPTSGRRDRGESQ